MVSFFRVLIVGDHAPTRRGLCSLLSSHPDWVVCGEAVDGTDAVEKAKSLRPDIVLMDISMPRMNGLDATKIIRQEVPESEVVIVSQNDPTIGRKQALKLNAAGYVDKSNLSRDLIPTLDEIFKKRNSEGAAISKNDFASLSYSQNEQPVRPEVDESSHPNDARQPEEKSAPPVWLTGSGEMIALIRAKDWSKTPIGPPEKWSPALRMMISFMLANRFPLLLWWGPQYVSIYNDAYRPILGTKHPKALGLPVSEVWNEIWDVLQPLIDTPFHGGPATWMEDLALEIRRSDFTEETHFTVAYSPVPDATADGGIGGVLATVHEITAKIISERRVAILAEYSARATEAKSAEQACIVAAEVLSAHPKDVPFALIYLMNRDDETAQLAGTAGTVAGKGISPHVIALSKPSSDDSGWPLVEAMRTEQLTVIENIQARFDEVPNGPWSDPPHRAVVVPIRSNKEHEPAGVLVAGISSRLALDPHYRNFFDLIAAQIAAAISSARAHEDERKRAESLVELDRAKTKFFSNISHEFRTPLTLMLGPVEDLLSRSDSGLPLAARNQLELVNRNGSRLLRLVNSLLDFSRIEAGRIEVAYEPTDLSTLTADLASVFRSATERAGLRLEVDCSKLDEPVFVDRNMWEKIVLNLMSNAFKFTFEGEIGISLVQVENTVELRVRDTGVGIPANELPRLFDRFHRVQNARSRTHEGSGIGLALVQELVRLHGGAVRVESAVGKGSTFVVSLPLGNAHLPSERIGNVRSLASTATGAAPFLGEALGWISNAEPSSPDNEWRIGLELMHVAAAPVSPNGGSSPERPYILIADDNADMRRYLTHLLAERYEVRVVPNGKLALEVVRERSPNLIVSDVMMPELDGFGLLQAVRSDPGTKAIPVILLSARAGEESRVEGMEHGADDYLIKPFSARELLARVQSHLEMARARKQAGEILRDKERRLRIATEAAQLGIWQWYLDDGRITWENNRPNEIFGRTREDGAINAAEFRTKILHPDDAQAFDFAVSRMLQTSARFFFQGRIRRKDGVFAWIELTGQLEHNADGSPWRVLGTVLDITESKEVDERERRITAEAMAATAKFRAVFEQSSVFAWILTLDGTVIDANRMCLEACGYRPEEVLGRPLWDTGWWRGSREVQDKIRAEAAQAAQGTPFLEILPYYWADGTERLLEFALHPILDTQGQVIFLYLTGIDITERKQAERTMALLAAIVDSSDDAIISKNLDGIITSWNQGAERVFGYSAEGAVGQHITLIIPPDWQNEEVEILDRLRGGEQFDHFETVRERKDGTKIDVSLTISPVKDGDGRIVGASKVVRDITHRKRFERALRESEERFRAIVETTPECVKLVASDGTLFHMNSSGLAMVGADCADVVVGKNIYALIAPKDCEKFRAFNERICLGEKGALEFDMVGLKGTVRRMESHAAPLQIPDGTIVQLAVTRDITERTRAQAELRKSEEQLRRLTRELETQVRGRTQELEQRNAEILEQSELLRDLSRRLLQAQDQERRHIARELHDSAGQIVTVLGIHLARISQRMRQNGNQIAEDLEDCRELAQQLSQEIRTTSYLLYPPLLDETGLNQALCWYIQGLMQRSGLDIKLNISEGFGRLSREMELVVYRLVQECLTNIHRHSGSKSAVIDLIREGEIVSLEIRDVGKGIPPGKLDLLQLQGAGVGIRGMRERVRQFNGLMNIKSNDDGTTISFVFHLSRTPSSNPENRGLEAGLSG